MEGVAVRKKSYILTHIRGGEKTGPSIRWTVCGLDGCNEQCRLYPGVQETFCCQAHRRENTERKYIQHVNQRFA
jgi:hypothetical protein